MSYECKEFPCVVCGESGEGMVTYHHILTRGSHPEFSECKWNMIPACGKCHQPKFHQVSTRVMAVLYPSVRNWLLNNDWYYCDYSNKWRREHGKD